MEKLLRKTNDGGYNFWCPACKCVHHLDHNFIISGNKSPTVDKIISTGRDSKVPIDIEQETRDCLGNDNDRWKKYIHGQDEAVRLIYRMFIEGMKRAIEILSEPKLCTLTIENGKINFHPESEHELAGETIDMVTF